VETDHLHHRDEGGPITEAHSGTQANNHGPPYPASPFGRATGDQGPQVAKRPCTVEDGEGKRGEKAIYNSHIAGKKPSGKKADAVTGNKIEEKTNCKVKRT
jgi:hypothetical protein